MDLWSDKKNLSNKVYFSFWGGNLAFSKKKKFQNTVLLSESTNLKKT